MTPRFPLLLSALLVGLAPSAALSCSNDLSTSTAAPSCSAEASTFAAAPAPRPHPRAAEIVAYRPHAWRPVSFAVAAGMVISIDPVDGAITVPAPASLESALRVTLGEDLAPAAVFQRADGSVRVQLDERWESHAVATFGPDGKPRWTFVDGTRGAAQFMKQPFVPAVVSSVPVPEEK